MKEKIIKFLYSQINEVEEYNKEKLAHMIVCLETNSFPELENYNCIRKNLKMELFQSQMFLKIKTFDDCKRIIELKLHYDTHLTNECDCKKGDKGYNEEHKCCLTENCNHSHPKLIYKVINNKSLASENIEPKDLLEKTKKILGE